MSRELLDLYSVMQRVPEIMGFELKWHGSAWQGGYYMDGTKHHKADKMKVKFYRGGDKCKIYVYEQGGESMSLESWLIKYGGAADWKGARDIMRGYSISERRYSNIHVSESAAAARHVPVDEWKKEYGCEYARSPLYVWMCSLYPEKDVLRVWHRYGMTVTPNGDVTFWYIDKDRRICHDKRIRYRYDGHRDKDFGCRRHFKVGDGYTYRCAFGEHLIRAGETVHCVESEKTCLICSLEYPDRTFVAVGGKNNLSLVANMDCVLYPDYDARMEWAAAGKTINEWWRGHDVTPTEDIGDLIICKRKYLK